MFEYNHHTGIFTIYCYVNNRSEIIEKDDLKAWEERMMRLGFIDEKQQAAFRQLCDNIQAGSESFATTLRTTLMSKGERMDVLRFRGQTIYNGEERVLTIGLMTEQGNRMTGTDILLDSAVVNQVLNEELQMTDVISMLKSMTSVTLSVMYIVCVVVMSLLTVLWLKGHSKMIAIYNTLGQKKSRTIQILLYEILMITVPAIVGAGILTLGLLNRFSVNIFKYFVEFCEISNFQKSFSLDIWNFEMNIWQFVYRIGFLEISVILITMIGSFIYANKSLRTLRSN